MNPITYARIEAGLSKEAFRKKLRVSRTYVIRAEQGCYTNPGSKLIEFSCRQLKVSETEFKKKYADFQNEQRARAVTSLESLRVPNRLKAGEDVNGPGVVKVLYSDVFKSWREDYWNSPITLASTLCLHPDSISNYEAGAYNSMPIIMARVLKDLNLIDPTFDCYARWCYVHTQT